MHIPVQIGDQETTALLDTGSAVTILSYSIFNQLQGKIELTGAPICLNSFGRNTQKSIGSFDTKLRVGMCEVSANVVVVPDHMMMYNMLIGRDVISQGELKVHKDGMIEFSIENNTEYIVDNTNVLGNSSSLLSEEFSKICQIDVSETVDVSHIRSQTVKCEVREIVASYTPKVPSSPPIQMKLELSDNTPVHRPPRRLAPQEREAVAKQIEEWLRDGIIQHSRSPYASPIVVVRKKNGSNRLCVDYRELNVKIIKDRYPLPVIEEVLEQLANARVFSTLDLKNGFFHVGIEQKSRSCTAFITPDGHYEFLRVPFGLCNSPAVFQYFINTVFRDLIKAKIVVVYMDDLIIPGVDEIDNLNNIKKVLKVAAENGLLIQFSKCQFVMRKVNFLGHILEAGLVRPSEEKTEAIRSYPQPKNIKQVMSFLGLAGFFRRFVPGFSLIAKPLSDLTRAEVVFKFEKEQIVAFNALKTILCEKPVLKLYDESRETELHTDASKWGFGACLLQRHDGILHPVFYYSRKTSPAETKYSSYELEVLAVISALKKLRVYLLGLKFKIITDCKAFQQTMTKRDISAKIARWALQLEEFDCSVEHRAGTAMRHVDALSRCPEVLAIEDGVRGQIKARQAADEKCQNIINNLNTNGSFKDFQFNRGVLYWFKDGRYLVVVPQSMQTQILRKVHELGHKSVRRMMETTNHDYYIDSLESKCKKIVSNCVDCILASRKAGHQEGWMSPIDVGTPLSTYHVDHLGPLPSTIKAYKYLFVVVDSFTKFTWIYPVKDTSVAEVLKRLELQKNVFGQPGRLITDRGSAFTSTDFKDYCKAEKIEHRAITTGVPRGNGQVERTHAIIIPILTKLSVQNPLKWYQHVYKVQRFINASKSRSTGKTPFEMLIGVPMRNPEDTELAKILEEELRADFENERDEIRKVAKETIERVQEQNRKYYNKNRKDAIVYKEGDWCAIKRTQFATGAKLQPDYIGPYVVIKVRANDRYDVERVGNGLGPRLTSTAADLMKPWPKKDDDAEEDNEGAIDTPDESDEEGIHEEVSGE